MTTLTNATRYIYYDVQFKQSIDLHGILQPQVLPIRAATGPQYAVVANMGPSSSHTNRIIVWIVWNPSVVTSQYTIEQWVTSVNNNWAASHPDETLITNAALVITSSIAFTYQGGGLLPTFMEKLFSFGAGWMPALLQ